jgi:hypothetical protein
MVNRERDDNVYYARLAEQGERYEDMIRYMKEVAAVSNIQIIPKKLETERAKENIAIKLRSNLFHG